MNKILFFYEKCQLKCEYCHFEFNKDGFTGYNEQHNVGQHLSADQILDGLESLIPYHIEFTGGEPTIFNEFKDIVNGLPDSCTWAITSNTLTNITGLDFDKCAHWTASYHGFQMDKYKENIKYLVENNTPLSISVVIPFNDFDKYVAMAKDLKVLGCRVNILRELNPEVNWNGTRKLDQLRAMSADGFHVVEEGIPTSYEFESGFLCVGGSSYYALYPDGQMFRCFSHMMQNRPLTNLHDFEKARKLFRCETPCLECAEDRKARKRKLFRYRWLGKAITDLLTAK